MCIVITLIMAFTCLAAPPRCSLKLLLTFQAWKHTDVCAYFTLCHALWQRWSGSGQIGWFVVQTILSFCRFLQTNVVVDFTTAFLAFYILGCLFAFGRGSTTPAVGSTLSGFIWDMCCCLFQDVALCFAFLGTLHYMHCLHGDRTELSLGGGWLDVPLLYRWVWFFLFHPWPFGLVFIHMHKNMRLHAFAWDKRNVLLSLLVTPLF